MKIFRCEWFIYFGERIIPDNSTLTVAIDAIDNTKTDKSYVTENKLLTNNVKVYPVPQLEMREGKH